MPEASAGDTVTVEYTGTLPDGTVFDSSRDRQPLEFTVGADEVIDGFDRAVVGMAPGETKEVTLQADEAYGDRDDELVFQVGRGQLPEELDPRVGDELEVRQENGQTFPVHVTATDDDSVTLDANHPLAGRDLTFEIELLELG